MQTKQYHEMVAGDVFLLPTYTRGNERTSDIYVVLGTDIRGIFVFDRSVKDVKFFEFHSDMGNHRLVIDPAVARLALSGL